MSTNINIVVKDKDTPVPDTGVITPDTGRYTNTNSNSASMEGGMIAFTIILSSLLLLSIALIFFSRLFRKKAINTTTNSTTNKANLYSSNNKTNSIVTNSIAKKANLFRTLGLLLFIFTATTGIVANILKNTSFPTYATDTPLDITTSDTTITVVREDGPAFAVASAEITLNEATPAGYNLYVYGPDGNQFTSTTTTATIDTIAEKNSIISNNTYGVANTTNEPLITDAVWNPVGDTEDNAELIATTTNATNVGDKITIYYGILVDETLPAGIYTGSIEYKAYTRTYTITYDANGGTFDDDTTTTTQYIAKGSSIGTLPDEPERDGYTFNGWFDKSSHQQVNTESIPTRDITYYAAWAQKPLTLQDTAAIVKAVNGSPTYTITAEDSRDGTQYTVGKLADGRIWMLDNLALDLTDSAVRTKMDYTNTNASDESLYALFHGVEGGGDNGNLARSAVVAWTLIDDDDDVINGSYGEVWDNVLTNTAPYLDASYKSATMSEATSQEYDYWDEDWPIGIFYNFCAASAGSYCYEEAPEYVDAREDICPRGWRLPASGGYSENTGEFDNLYNAYAGDSQYYDFVIAFRDAFVGQFITKPLYAHSGYTVHWSSTYNKYNGMFYLFSDGVDVGERSDYFGERDTGSSIRCIMDN